MRFVIRKIRIRNIGFSPCFRCTITVGDSLARHASKGLALFSLPRASGHRYAGYFYCPIVALNENATIACYNYGTTCHDRVIGFRVKEPLRPPTCMARRFRYPLPIQKRFTRGTVKCFKPALIPVVQPSR